MVINGTVNNRREQRNRWSLEREEGRKEGRIR